MDIPVVGARFRAIIAGPLNGSPGSPDRQQNGYESYGGVRFQEAPGVKRKKDHDEAAPIIPKKTVRRTSEDEGGSAREPTISYRDREALLSALQDRFNQGPHVDFHGTYEIYDIGLSHKARITSMAIEIWKSTGYRFTVKDHPQFSNGHKTRFWCSQDDAHRSKSSRAARKAQGDLYKPRQSSSGEALAKARFPCRSRLLISSRDSDTPGRPIVTVRMHHHVSHEPYVDLNLPPEVAHSVYDRYWAMAGARPITNGSDRNPSQPVHTFQQSDGQALSEEDSPEEQETFHDIPPELPNDISPENHPRGAALRDHEPPPPPPHSTTPQNPTVTLQDDIFQRRMRAHITNLENFCDGLKYQLQFKDNGLLEEMERKGAPFFDFMAECLRKEGLLVSTDQDTAPHTTTHSAPPNSNRVAHVDQPTLQQPFGTIHSLAR